MGKRFNTGVPCKNGHMSDRYVNSGKCVTCVELRVARYRSKNPDISKKASVTYYNKNKETIIEYRKSHRSKIEVKANTAKTSLKWRTDNKEYHTELIVRWKSKNRHRLNASESSRRASKLQATPSWLTDDQKESIITLYEIAKEYELITGEQHHVDHIIPLKGKNVCGLHVPWNLSVIPATANMKKGNKYFE